MISAFCLFTLSVTSLVNIYAHWIDDGLVGRILYMGLFITSGAGLVHLLGPGQVPGLVWTTLLVMVTLSFLRGVCLKSFRYFKYWRVAHAKRHQ